MLTQSIRIRIDTGHQRASLQDREMCRGEIAQYGEVAGSRESTVDGRQDAGS